MANNNLDNWIRRLWMAALLSLRALAAAAGDKPDFLADTGGLAKKLGNLSYKYSKILAA